MKKIDITVAAAILLFTSSHAAHAYIDPGTGSVVMTALLGFIAAIGYTARKYFYKIKNIFTKDNTGK